VLPPLFLHEGQGEETRLSAAALSFCPSLACNAAPGKTNSRAGGGNSEKSGAKKE
jgi:tRNA1Val (adenine37-N6)-methyltransferase